MTDLTPLQIDAIRIALQFHAVLIQQTLQALQPKEGGKPPQEPQN